MQNTIEREKEYLRNILYIVFRIWIRLIMSDNKIKMYLEKLFEVIIKEFPSAKIFLFGSRARNLNLKTVDIDIGIEESHKIDLIKLERVKENIDNLNIPYKVDLVDFKRVSKRFYKIAKKEIVQWKN